jgi:YD repeat-containing protein
VKNSVSTTDYVAYDGLGRVLRSQQTIAGLAALSPFVYTYNHVALQTMTYPSGRVVSYGYDRAGRVTSVNGLTGGIGAAYAGDAQYEAHGVSTRI